MHRGFTSNRLSTLADLATSLLTLAAAATALVAAEAGAADSAVVVAHQARLILSEPPKEAQQVLTVFKELVAEKNRPDAPKSRDVVVVGQLGGMPNIWPDTHPDFPWYPGQASFFMVDSKIAKQFAQHAKHHGGSDDCVFCRQLAAKNVNAIAVVNFVDDDGKTLAIDLHKLIDLKENQTVIIRGKAKLLAGSLLQIDADGIYVNQPTTAARPVRKSAK